MTRVGVIGTGSMGKNHIRVYSEIGGVDLVAISDISQDNKDIAQKYRCRFYADYREMLKNENLDAVSIVVPTSLHKEVALDCIDNGINILMEKPISDTVENARIIIDRAEKKGIILAVGHIERFNPAVIKLKEIINGGDLGEITSMVARRVGIFPPQIKDANVYLDLAVHDIDIFNFLLEKDPLEIFSVAGRALSESREDHAWMMITYPGAVCINQVNWITPVKVRNLAVTGTKGYVELNYISQELKLYESRIEGNYDSFGDFVVKFGESKEKRLEINKEEPLKKELEHFVACVENKTEPLVTGLDGLKALKYSLDAMKSNKEKRIVRIEK